MQTKIILLGYLQYWPYLVICFTSRFNLLTFLNTQDSANGHDSRGKMIFKNFLAWGMIPIQLNNIYVGQQRRGWCLAWCMLECKEMQRTWWYVWYHSKVTLHSLTYSLTTRNSKCWTQMSLKCAEWLSRDKTLKSFLTYTYVIKSRLNHYKYILPQDSPYPKL